MSRQYVRAYERRKQIVSVALRLISEHGVKHEEAEQHDKLHLVRQVDHFKGNEITRDNDGDKKKCGQQVFLHEKLRGITG